VISRDVEWADAEAAAEVVLSAIDGLLEDQ